MSYHCRSCIPGIVNNTCIEFVLYCSYLLYCAGKCRCHLLLTKRTSSYMDGKRLLPVHCVQTCARHLLHVYWIANSKIVPEHFDTRLFLHLCLMMSVCREKNYSPKISVPQGALRQV